MQWINNLNEAANKITPLSKSGWIGSIIFNLIIVILSGVSLGVTWWIIRVWDSDDKSVCNQYVSLLMNHGACSEDGMGKMDQDNCIKFTSHSDWKNIDDYFSAPLSTYSNSDFVGAAEKYSHAKGLIITAIFFTCINIVLGGGVLAIIPKSLHKIVQCVILAFTCLSCLCLLCGFAITGNNSMTNADYWQQLLCAYVTPYTNLSNSYYTLPYTGYLLVVTSFLISFISISYHLYPGSCCFLSCNCCSFAKEDEEAVSLTQATEVPGNKL
jgi:hypothetical protein